MHDKCHLLIDINLPIIRTQIIEFFSLVKLNKNIYFPEFYKKRNSEHIFHYINNYFNNNKELCNVNLSQKYYHIYHNLEKIPKDVKFVNFVVGYRKGKRTVQSKKISWLKFNINNEIIIPIQHYSLVETYDVLLSYTNVMAYKSLLGNLKLKQSILYHSNLINETLSNFDKLVVIYNKIYKYSDILCRCSNILELFKLKFLKTCGNKCCKSLLFSEIAKKRDNSCLQSLESKIKRTNSRIGYRHSDETKLKISNSNKKTWTKELRCKLVADNIKNGVYEKSSTIMKLKILNGEFTPKTSNRLNHKRLTSDITGIKNYRSNWEVQFHENFPNLLYEKLRIKYSYKNKIHVYIVDFIDDIEQIIYEIKPKSMCDNEKTICKLNAAKEWCIKNNYTLKIITENEYRFN